METYLRKINKDPSKGERKEEQGLAIGYRSNYQQPHIPFYREERDLVGENVVIIFQVGIFRR